MENLFVYFYSKYPLEFLVDQRVKSNEHQAKSKEEQSKCNKQQPKCNK